MKHRLAFALLLSGFSAIAQTQTAKKPQSGPPPLPPMAYELEDAFGGVKFSQPVAIVSAPGEMDRLFVVEKTGCIQVITQLDQPTPAKKVFATIIERPDGKLDAQGECGLLGLAFHPDYAVVSSFIIPCASGASSISMSRAFMFQRRIAMLPTKHQSSR
jgi:hypothetical protein